MNDYLAREMSATVTEPADAADLGSQVQALVYVPRTAAAGKVRAPLVVCCHGLGESGLRVAPVAQRLAGAGAVAICPSFRGGGAPTAGRTAGMSVLTELADLEAVLTVARSWPFVDTSRVALFGRSLGGLVAALEGARRPSQVSALALWYPALRAPAGLRSRFSSPAAAPPTFAHRVDGGTMTLGQRYVRHAWGIDVDAELRALRAPVLLVHGEEDRDVPIAVSEAALRTLPDARLVRVPGAAHGFRDERFETALRATTDFLAWTGVLEG